MSRQRASSLISCSHVGCDYSKCFICARSSSVFPLLMQIFLPGETRASNNLIPNRFSLIDETPHRSSSTHRPRSLIKHHAPTEIRTHVLRSVALIAPAPLITHPPPPQEMKRIQVAGPAHETSRTRNILQSCIRFTSIARNAILVMAAAAMVAIMKAHDLEPFTMTSESRG